MSVVYNAVAMLWRLPGFFLSFMFYRGTRALILSAARRMFDKKLKSREKLEWIAYSESLQVPGALPYMMCTTSRWNPHAPLGSFGPLWVESKLQIRVADAMASARGWIITVFRGDFEVAALIYPGNTTETEWKTLQLPRGQYRILVRYYGYSGDTVFPAVKADGMVQTEARNVGNEMQKSLDFFNARVVDHKGLFYFLTQYYIFQLLRWQRYLPAALVRRLYLPVGDPQITSYSYGILQKGGSLFLDFDDALLDQADVYVTYCNRWGFPVFWDNVSKAPFISRIAPRDVVYLVRVVNFRNEQKLDLDAYRFICSTLGRKRAKSVQALGGAAPSRTEKLPAGANEPPAVPGGHRVRSNCHSVQGES